MSIPARWDGTQYVADEKRAASQSVSRARVNYRISRPVFNAFSKRGQNE